jgi:NAD(P)-dependent dehydrogenase (short-subunit alcohol dehydrogenase family)
VGIGTSTIIGEIEDGLPEKLYKLNVCGFIYGLEYVLPFMENGSSATVISSINAWRSEPKMAVYDSTKAALIQYVRTASVDLGPRGIRINAVAPGYIRTPQTIKELEDPANAKKISEATSLERIGEPEDVSGVVVAISSNDFGFVTGSVIEVSGGLAAAQYAPMKKQINIQPDIEGGMSKK